jgi:prevent-host-death family protein
MLYMISDNVKTIFASVRKKFSGRGVVSISLTEAKAHLSEVVARAAAGERVLITRRGKPVAQITAAETPRRKIDLGTLRALTDAMPARGEGAGAMRCGGCATRTGIDHVVAGGALTNGRARQRAKPEPQNAGRLRRGSLTGRALERKDCPTGGATLPRKTAENASLLALRSLRRLRAEIDAEGWENGHGDDPRSSPSRRRADCHEGDRALRV